ncbi:NAD(P)/FAD-dependent oxidoreductase [Thalassolituus sp.]|jgi:cation diffusion facilitator CzcD-associated flavoprotein CzcO|uniref:flavin-containing monooxygenase n=1 Tax=Thalassolituus sp. TaxID=2030822 RepID=UPI002A7FBA3D|nr:NAD(P)/FAD-dependent oxidoreductase [Thalassolituus sp.]
MSKEYFDVLIIGAGLSGIGTACHLKKEAAGKTFAILEGRTAIGGTWDLFRYPGIRSDSDMFTLGYEFKPWTQRKGIADGEDIRNYIREAATEYNIEPHIRYSHKVKSAAWSTKDAQWTVDVELSETGETKQYICSFFISCTGYYNYEQGFTPDFEGRDDYKGQVLHPQFWPENLDYQDKKVVVIGSGATAVTLVPAMTDKAQKVTMLQRSPSYVLSVPQEDIMVNGLRKILPESWVYRIIRGRNVSITLGIYKFCKAFPSTARNLLQGMIKRQLPADFDMTHFTPKYNPWDERLCAVPNGDMFKAIKQGKADVVTDHIDRFTEKGLLLKSGKELEADIIVTATGLQVQMLGNMKLSMDGEPLSIADKMSFRGAMFEDIPNFSMVFGYTNASWTLKADLIASWVCGLMKHMNDKGLRQVTPRNHDSSMEKVSFIEMQSGYIARIRNTIPRQGTKKPWKLYQNYMLDMASLKLSSFEEETLEYSNPIQTSEPKMA